MLAMIEGLGHKQPATGSPLETNNRTAHDILNSKRSKNSPNPSTRDAGG
jgi:hypothetical protein